jgi:hypothetical protein
MAGTLDMSTETTDTGTAHSAPEKVDLAAKRRHFRAYETNKSREIDEQREARRYYNGKQWTDKEKRILENRGQPVITDNRIARKIDFIVGVEERMRRDPKAYPRTPKHTQAADVVTAGVRFVCDQNHWDRKASDAASDGMQCGIGVAWVGIESKSKGPEVIIKNGQVDRFWYDSRSVAPDFSDARHLGMHLWLDIEDAVAQWPHKDQELRNLVDRDNDTTTSTLESDRSEQWGDYEQKRVRVIEYWERRNSPAGQVWYYCFFSGDIDLDSGWSTFLDEDGQPDCPWVAWSPYVDEVGDRYGLIRNMKPLQDETNHRRSKLLHRVSVRQLHMQEHAVSDVDDFRKENAKPDGILVHQGVWGETVGVVDQSFEARGEAELLQQSLSALENYGPNPGLLGKGQGVDGASGVALQTQRDSGMTELSPVFQRLRDFKLRVYKKVWARMKQSWTSERWIAVTDDDNAPSFIGLNQYGIDPMSGQATAQNVLAEMDVDIILDEGPDTIVMQEELLQTMSQLGEAAAGPLGKIMIELTNVPNKERLLKMLDEVQQPPPEMQALQQRNAQLEEAMKVATVEKTQSETAKNVSAAKKSEADAAKVVNDILNPPPPPVIRGNGAAPQRSMVQ